MPRIESLDSNGLMIVRFNATMDVTKAFGNETINNAPLTRQHEYNFDDDEFIIYGKASENAANKNFTQIHSGTIEYE